MGLRAIGFLETNSEMTERAAVLPVRLSICIRVSRVNFIERPSHALSRNITHGG